MSSNKISSNKMSSRLKKSPLKKSDITKINKSPTVKKGKEGEIKKNENIKGFVSKVFNDDKTDLEIKREYEFMEKGYELGVSPRPILYNTNGKCRYMIMEELDYTLFDHIKNNNGEISDYFQNQMISILNVLDKNKIFHGDVSPLNFMISKNKGKNKDKLYIIDYGMAKKMTKSFIEKNGEHSNIKLGLTFFILKIREVIPSFEPKILLKEIYKNLKL